MKARRLIGGGALVAALSVVVGGCVVEVNFDPLGDDFSASGEWTINGEPANADTCAAAGVETVELVFFHEGSPYRYSELTFPCSAGAFETDKIFSYGSYTTQWWALNAGGARIDDSPMRPLVVNAPIEHANLEPFDIEADTFNPLGDDNSLSADWTINGMAPTADLCAAAGFETVAITLYAEDDTDYANGVTVAEAPCANGKYDSRDPGEPGAIIRDGRYRTSIDGLDSTGAVVDSFRSEFILDTTAASTVHAMLMTADFEAAVVPTLTVYFQWDTDPSAGGTSFADCTTAGVANFSYMLTPAGGGANYDEATEIACEAGLMWEDIPPGTYSIYIEGEDGDGVKRWMVTCTELVVADAGLSEYTCEVTDNTGG